MPIRTDAIFDNSPPDDFRVTIGGVDITQLVLNFQISKPIPGQREPQLISGFIEIRQPLNVGAGRDNGVYAPGLENFEIDPIRNPDFKAFAQPIEFFAEGRVICILRLTEDLRYDFTTGLGRGELGHKLLNVTQQTSNAVTNFAGAVRNVYDASNNFSVDILPIGVYAQRILDHAVDGNGVSPFSASDLDISALPTTLRNTYNQSGTLQTAGFESNQDFSGSVDEVIHGIFFENASQALEPVPGTERLRASDPYPIVQGDLTPRLRLPYTQTIITPENISIDAPATIAQTSSGPITSRVKRTSGDYPKEIITARFADRSPAETTIIDRPVDEEDRVVTTYTRRAVERWLIEGSTGTNIVTRSEVKTETFGNQGEPIRRERVFTLTRHELGKLPVPGLGRYVQPEKDKGSIVLNQGLTITTEWDYDNDGNLLSEAVTYELGRQYVFEGATGDGKVVALREEIVNQNTVSSTVNPRWETFTTRMIPQGLIEKSEESNLVADENFRPESRPIDRLPRPEYRTAKQPITIQRFSNSIVEGEVLGADANPAKLDIQATYGASDEALNQLGRTLLAMNAQLREVWDVRMALPAGFDLFGSWDIYHIDNGQEARAIALVAPFLVYENNGQQETLTYGGTAAQLGTLTERIRPIAAPVQPIRYMGPGQPVPLMMGRIAANTVGQLLTPPYKLKAYGGTEPYVFSAINLPPGLSIVGDEIVGAPTAIAAEAEVTITVTDQATAMATTSFLALVRQIAAPSPSYKLFNDLFIASRTNAYLDIQRLNSVRLFIASRTQVYLDTQAAVVTAFFSSRSNSYLDTLILFNLLNTATITDWWNAIDVTPGTDVQTIPNKVAGRPALEQAVSGRRPNVALNVWSDQPAIVFDNLGLSKYLEATGVSTHRPSTYVFVESDLRVTETGAAALSFTAAPVTGQSLIVHVSGADGGILYGSSNTNQGVFTSFNNPRPRIHVFENTKELPGTTRGSAYVNGTLVTGLGGHDTSPYDGVFTVGRSAFGDRRVPGNYFQIMRFEGSLTERTRQIVEGVFAHQFGINLDLPVSHPYQLTSPFSRERDFHPLELSTITDWWSSSQANSADFSATGLSNHVPGGVALLPDAANRRPSVALDAHMGFSAIRFSDPNEGLSGSNDTEEFLRGSGVSTAFPATFVLVEQGVTEEFQTLFGYLTQSILVRGNNNFAQILGRGPTNVLLTGGTSPRIWVITLSGVNDQTYSDVFVNGQRPTNIGSLFTTNALTGDFLVGAGFNAASNFARYDLFDLMRFDGVLSDSDRQLVEGFLAHRYSVQGDLVAGHPYQTDYPTIAI